MGQSREQRSFLAYFVEESCARNGGNVVSDFEFAISTNARSMYDTIVVSLATNISGRHI